MKIIIRADDLGYSEGVNFGILKSIDDGKINNVSMMSNTAYAKKGYDLIKDKGVCVGLHANISGGYPVSNPTEIDTLVNGRVFHKSSFYREVEEDIVDTEQARIEVEAQIEKFISITGVLPAYIDIHATNSGNFEEGVKEAALKYGITFVPADFSGRITNFKGYKLKTIVKSSEPNYEPKQVFIDSINNNVQDLLLFIFHPGFIDKYLYNHSSLLIPRIMETDYLCSTDFKDYLNKKKIECIRIDSLV
ncbi:ChbG/HpnK family deacetylase [Companilactobacillus sp. HBUAS56257]|uniref:ChbG/HpnK family deacetylase n=1 Tax=Companilactobacillus sp. HBUAS56257 TaxID=3109360 RepID=UPI002FEF3831